MIRFASAAAAVFVLSAPALATPDDIVPRGHPVYDLLGKNDPSLRRGDVFLTRRDARERLGKSPDPESALWAAMAREFGIAGEILVAKPAGAGSLTLRAADGAAVLGTDNRALSVRLAGAAPVGQGFAVGMAGSGWRDREGSTLETAYVTLPGRALDVTVGKRPIRWGPGYTGGLLFSDEGTSFAQIAAEKSFSLPGGLGKRLGRLRFEQLYGQSFESNFVNAEPNSRGTRRYLGGRRVSTDTDSRWSFSYAESIKNTRLPSPILSQILPYYVYQNDWTATSKDRWLPFLPSSSRQPNSFWLNFQADATVSYRDRTSGVTGYADYLLDDIKAPKGLGQNFRVPPRTGLLLGVHVPRFGADGRFDGRLEMARLDTLTYTNATPPLDWQRGGRPLGYNAGGNVNVLFARVNTSLSDRDGAALEYRSQRPRDASPELSGAAVPRKENRISLFAHRALDGRKFVGLRIDYVRGDRRGTRAEVRLGDAF